MLRKKLEKFKKRRNNFRYTKWLGNAFFCASNTISLTKIKLSFKERGRTGASGIPGDAEKSSNCTHKPHTEAIFEFNIFYNKEGWGETSCCKLERAEQEYINTLSIFLNGEVIFVKGNTTTRIKTMQNRPDMVSVSKIIWQYSLKRKIAATAEYLPGSLSRKAGKTSRHTRKSSEWKVNPGIFKQFWQARGTSETDYLRQGGHNNYTSTSHGK